MLVTKTVKSDTLMVGYKTFYSHLSKLKSEDTNALQFAFGFINIHTKQLCEINSARISTEKQQMPLTVTPEFRFTLPTEKVLKLANATVVLELTEKSNICDISVQLETKPEYLKTSYAAEELELIYQQYSNFFDDVGGFMSFMMPTVNGIIIRFGDKTLSGPLSNGMQISKGILSVNANEISRLHNVDLVKIPLRITAKTSK
jgi:hypothetical protein